MRASYYPNNPPAEHISHVIAAMIATSGEYPEYRTVTSPLGRLIRSSPIHFGPNISIAYYDSYIGPGWVNVLSIAASTDIQNEYHRRLQEIRLNDRRN